MTILSSCFVVSLPGLAGIFLILRRQQLLTIEDAAIVYWEPGKKRSKPHQAHSLAGAGAWAAWRPRHERRKLVQLPL